MGVGDVIVQDAKCKTVGDYHPIRRNCEHLENFILQVLDLVLGDKIQNLKSYLSIPLLP